MEIKETLQKPYTEEERVNFIKRYRYNYKIVYTDEAIEAWGLTAEEEAEQEAQKEAERKAKLKMTKRDFFLYVVKPFNVTYASLMQLLQSNDDIYACYEGCNHIYRYDEMLVGNIKTMLETLTHQTIDEDELNQLLDEVFEAHNAQD